jgi:hypothetical protein
VHDFDSAVSSNDMGILMKGVGSADPTVFDLEVRPHDGDETLFLEAIAPDDSALLFERDNDGTLRLLDLSSGDETVLQTAEDFVGADWGDVLPPEPCLGDLSGDCEVNTDDLFILLGEWGTCE